MKVSAVVVTRMDHDLGPVVESLRVVPEIEEIIFVKGHGGVWERYEASARAQCDVIYTQDDDAVVDVAAVLAAYEPGKVVCNMPMDRRAEYQDGCALVGWGAVFDKSLVWEDTHSGLFFTGALKEYKRWLNDYTLKSGLRYREPIGDVIFRSECDRVFTGLSDLKLIDVPFTHLPAAHGRDRMGRRACHGEYRQEIRRRIEAVRKWRNDR